jgi:hypothetical protein
MQAEHTGTLYMPPNKSLQPTPTARFAAGGRG